MANDRIRDRRPGKAFGNVTGQLRVVIAESATTIDDVTKEPEDLQTMASMVGVTTPYDRLVDGATDAISMVPFGGPLVAGLIRQAAPRDDETYLRDFAVETANRIVGIESTRIDRSYFESDEWASDVARVYDALRLERNRSKRNHYLAALANGATTDRPDEVERHRFMDLLDSLRPSHLRLLAAVAGTENDHSGGGIDVWMTTNLPDQDLENIKLDWQDLSRAGLLLDMPMGMASTPTGQRVWAAFQAIGRRFATYVEAQPTDEQDLEDRS